MKPTSAGIQLGRPSASAMATEGSSSDHTLAAIMTPAANPSMRSTSRWCMDLKPKTKAAPTAVIAQVKSVAIKACKMGSRLLNHVTHNPPLWPWHRLSPRGGLGPKAAELPTKGKVAFTRASWHRETMTNAPTNESLRQRIPLYPGQFLAAMAMASLGPLLDHMMTDLSIPLSQGGIINGGLFAGTTAGIILVNLTMARVPAKWIISGGTALLGIGLVVGGAAAHSLWALFMAFLVAGLAGAFIITTSWMWLSAHIKKNLAGSALALTLFFALGMITIPVIVGQAIDMGATWRSVMLVEGGFALVCALVFAFLPLLDVTDSHNVRMVAPQDRGRPRPPAARGHARRRLHVHRSRVGAQRLVAQVPHRRLLLQRSPGPACR